MNQFSNLSKEQFDALVQAEVEKQLTSREKAETLRQAEETLQQAKTTFDTMQATIEAKEAKIKEYEGILANLDLDPTAAEVAANEKVVELETSLTEWKHRAEIAEAALKTLELEETAAGRMDELQEAGVALDGETAEAQYVKVRGMSDDEFANYMGELVALKNMYASAAEEAEEDSTEVSALSADEVKMIAQSLGCDPADAKCISLVQEVANKMNEVSKNRRKAPMAPAEESKVVAEAAASTPAETQKEVASLSLGQALAMAVDQNIQAPVSLKEEIAQEWEKLHAAKREAKK